MHLWTSSSRHMADKFLSNLDVVLRVISFRKNRIKIVIPTRYIST